MSSSPWYWFIALAVFLTQAVSGQDRPSAEAPAGHWTFDDGVGLEARDSSPNGFTAKLVNGPVWVVPGKRGAGTISLDGIDDSINLGDHNLGQNVEEFTVSLWFKAAVPTLNSDRGLICYLQVINTRSFCLYIARGNGNGRINFDVTNASDTKALISADSRFASVDWTHVVGVYDGTNIKMYIDNRSQATQAALTGPVKDNTPSGRIDDLRIGYVSGATTFQGLIDDVRIYHRALSAEEIGELFNPTDHEPPSPPSHVVATPVAMDSIDLTWKLSTDNIGVTGYKVYRNGELAGSTQGAYFRDRKLTRSTTYGYKVTAFDERGNISPESAITSATTLAVNPPDVTAPVVKLLRPMAQVAAYGQLEIAAEASDNTELASVEFKLDGAKTIATFSSPPLLYLWDTVHVPNGRHVITAVAKDRAGNLTSSAPIAVSVDNVIAKNCSNNSFSFLTFSDTYSGFEGGLRRILSEAVDRDLNIRFLAGAGDTTPYQRVRRIIDNTLTSRANCGAKFFPWFPAVGNHDAEVQSQMDWWATNWAVGWEETASASRLATQLSGVSNFRRGPLQVKILGSSTLKVDAGTIYSFDYKNSHFVFINDYEQKKTEDIHDDLSGPWDVNGTDVFDPSNSQLDWLVEDLRLNKHRKIFVFNHVALVAPCYNYDPPQEYYPCKTPPPPAWSEHNKVFHTSDLARVLSEFHVTAVFFGHDHVPSRSLIDQNKNPVYERLYWDVVKDPNMPYSAAESLGPPRSGTVWQVDPGLVYNLIGSYVITKVTEDAVTFSIYRFESDRPGSTKLWDTWTVPLTKPSH